MISHGCYQMGLLTPVVYHCQRTIQNRLQQPLLKISHFEHVFKLITAHHAQIRTTQMDSLIVHLTGKFFFVQNL